MRLPAGSCSRSAFEQAAAEVISRSGDEDAHEPCPCPALTTQAGSIRCVYIGLSHDARGPSVTRHVRPRVWGGARAPRTCPRPRLNTGT
ncbi:hypothetical protein ACU4GR_06845 [Methylobacterium oryzae CBMB20]